MSAWAGSNPSALLPAGFMVETVFGSTKVSLAEVSLNYMKDWLALLKLHHTQKKQFHK